MALVWKKHPVLPIPTDEELAAMQPQEVVDLWEMREEAIRNAIEDPLRYGVQLEHWPDADELFVRHDEMLVLGGNRSSKTTYGARTVVQAATHNRNGLILCFAQDDTASKRIQQKAVYEWLPLELKQTVRSETGYIKYSLKNGFTGYSLILPDTKTTIAFHTYSQFLNNPAKFEGLELGSLESDYTNIGVWFDEYLLDSSLADTMRFRLATRDSKALFTFTSIDGETEFIAGYTRGADTLQDRYVDRFVQCTGRVPYIQEAKRRDAGLIYFHSDRNPFGGYERLARDLQGASKDEILTRFYGVPVKMKEGQFPNFRTSVNVMPHEEMMKVVRVDSQCTRYMVVDPAPNKRWYCVWIAVTEDGTWHIYRDWPDKGYGDWARMGGDNKSKLGEAAKTDGRGIADYVELWESLEKGEKIYERLIDPRMGASPRQVEEGTVTIIQQMEEHGLVFLQAPGGEELHGLSKLRSLMSYNVEKPVDAANRPMFYISDQCQQTIDCLLNYTATEGQKEAWKDGIDCLRYAAAAEIYHVGKNSMNVTRFGSGGY